MGPCASTWSNQVHHDEIHDLQLLSFPNPLVSNCYLILSWKGLFFMFFFLRTPRLTSSFWKSPDSKLDTAAMVQSCQSHTKHTQPNGWPEPQKNDEHDEIQLEAWYIRGTQCQDQGQGEQRNAGKKRRCCGFNLSTESTGRGASCQHLQYPLGKCWNNMEQGVATGSELHNLLWRVTMNISILRIPIRMRDASDLGCRQVHQSQSQGTQGLTFTKITSFLHHIHTTWSFHSQLLPKHWICSTKSFMRPRAWPSD